MNQEENEQYLYHVIFHFDTGKKNGFGSLAIETPEEINSSSSIENIKEYIKLEQKFDNVVILNWKQLKSW